MPYGNKDNKGMSSARMPDKPWTTDAGYVKSANMKYSNEDPAKELKKNADALATYVDKNKNREY